MFGIGEFSNLCMVTTKTLRHYDTIGLLKPVFQKEETGYRYYTVNQLNTMMIIKKLKDYGFSLEEIKQLKDADAKDLKVRIEEKLADQMNFFDKQQLLINEMKKDLLRLEKGEKIMGTKEINVEILDTKTINTVSVREVINMKDFDVLLGKAFAKLHTLGATCASGPMAIYHCKEFNPLETDVEICIPVLESMEGTTQLKGKKCAMGVHTGSYGNIPQTYTAIAKWVEEKGYKVSDYPYEKYINSPKEVKEQDLVTEIYFPIEK